MTNEREGLNAEGREEKKQSIKSIRRLKDSTGKHDEAKYEEEYRKDHKVVFSLRELFIETYERTL